MASCWCRSTSNQKWMPDHDLGTRTLAKSMSRRRAALCPRHIFEEEYRPWGLCQEDKWSEPSVGEAAPKSSSWHAGSPLVGREQSPGRRVRQGEPWRSTSARFCLMTSLFFLFNTSSIKNLFWLQMSKICLAKNQFSIGSRLQSSCSIKRQVLISIDESKKTTHTCSTYHHRHHITMSSLMFFKVLEADEPSRIIFLITYTGPIQKFLTKFMFFIFFTIGRFFCH